MQKNISQLTKHSQSIAVDPRLTKERRSVRRKRVTFFGSLLLFVCSLACFFLFGSIFRPYSLSWILIGIFIFAVASVLGLSAHGVTNLTKQLTALERLEARRQAVVLQGDQHHFPVKPLASDATALPLPFPFRQSARGTRVLGSLIMLMPAIGLLVWGWLLYRSTFPTSNLMSFQLMASGGVFVIAMLRDFYRYYSAWREQLMLTEDGLTISNLWGRQRIIPWEEARLFAFDGCLVHGRKSFTLLFELSSDTEVICWEWVVSINTALPPQTDLPLFSQGHDLQLEALLSLIAGRTRLPLYDLQEYKVRKPR